MKALAIATVNVRRMLRERSNVFFVFVFPMLLILVIGATFGGQFEPRIGIVDLGADDLSEAVVADVASIDGITVEIVDDRSDLVDLVERGRLSAGIVVPSGVAVETGRGATSTIEFIARQDSLGQQLRSVIAAVAAEHNSRLAAAAALATIGGQSSAEALATVEAAQGVVGGVTVTRKAVGEQLFDDGLSRFDLGAAQQLLLFTFLTSLAGSAALIQTRQFGVSRRMLSTPTPTRQILLGETLGRFGVALVQSVFIMVGALVVFGVNWGDPLGAVALIVMFSLVGSGAGMLAGSLFSNDQQAGSMGVFAGLGLAALGGCMVPLEVFSPTMQRVAHLTPHAWALDGFAALVRQGGSIADIGSQLAVLAGFAAALLTLATFRLRAVLTR